MYKSNMNSLEKVTPSDKGPQRNSAIVLMQASVPESFCEPAHALRSECTSLIAVVSGVDSRGVDFIRALLSGKEPPQVRVVLLVHAACPTTEKDLYDLLALAEKGRLEVFVLPVSGSGQRSSWVRADRRTPPSHVLWTSSAGNFGLGEPKIEEPHLVADADPLLIDGFERWFHGLKASAAPLTAETARIPALVAARGSTAGAEAWQRYVACCQMAALRARAATPAPSAAPQSSPAKRSVQVVEQNASEEQQVAKPDELLKQLVRLFEQGDLVTIDKGSRIPPLEVPVKAEWFGIPSFRETGVVSREIRYKISILDKETNKRLEARRKGISELREKFSFPLADGSRWMPHAARELFLGELKLLEEEGKKLLQNIISGEPEKWVQSQRNLVARDANRLYVEFHPGETMPEETINEILKALTERFSRATSGNFLPKVSFIRTSFRAEEDSEHLSQWAAPRTLLKAIAEYPRAALTNRAYFFRGLKATKEDDLLDAMNVADDRFVSLWFERNALDTAEKELQVLKQIDECEMSDRDKCTLILDLLHQNQSLSEIQRKAQERSK